MLARTNQKPDRDIIYRTRGHGQGPITRLMSPGDAAALVKPFAEALSQGEAEIRRIGREVKAKRRPRG